MATENPETFAIYNETIQALRAHCARYLRILSSDQYDERATTKLDRHRANFCRRSVEEILKRIKRNGELPNNNYMRIAMVHAYQYLKKLRDLCEEVSRQTERKLKLQDSKVKTYFAKYQIT